MRRAALVVALVLLVVGSAVAYAATSTEPAVHLKADSVTPIDCPNALSVSGTGDSHTLNATCAATATTIPATTVPPPTTLPATTVPPPTTLPPQRVNVKTAGAKCDGTTDDTATIQAAALTASAAVPLYFPPGTCRVRLITVPIGVEVIGDGSASIIKQTRLTTFTDVSPVFDALGGNRFSYIKIDGNRTENRADGFSDAYNNVGRGYKNSVCCGRGRGYRPGIRMESASGLTVDHTEIIGTAGAAVATNMASNVTVSNNNIHDTDFEALYASGDGYPVADVSGTNVNFVRNTMNNIKAPASAGSTQPNGLVISRAIGGSISDNTATNTDRDFIKCEGCQNYLISGNTASAGSTSVNYPNVALQPMYNRHDLGSRHVRITNNNLSGPGHQGGVQINSSSTMANAAEDIEVDNNKLGPNLVYGVLMDGTVGLNGINVHNNSITGTSSAAIYVNGGGTNLAMNTNTHGGAAMANVNIPGAFQQSKYYN